MTEKILSHYKKVDPVIYEVIKDLDYTAWFSEQRVTNQDYFNSLCNSIISQQLSGKAAKAIVTKFTNLLPHKEITPENILKLEDQTIRDAGLSWAKIKYIKDLSSKVLNGELELLNLSRLSEDEVIKELVKVKGIGNWTAEMFLMFTLKREDVFSYGDLGLKKGIMKLYNLNEPTQEKIAEIITPWSPYKTYGSIALWQSLENS